MQPSPNFLYDCFTWGNIKAFLDSNFTSSLVGALAGAFAGAMAAQRIADRAKQRKELLEEIRNTNAAITVAISICNAGLKYKKQFIKKLYDDYIKNKTEIEEIMRKREQGLQQPKLPFEFQADLQTIPMPIVPIIVLRTLIFEKISASGRPLALVVEIEGVFSVLEDALQKRHDLIEQYKKINAKDPNMLAALYFGLPLKDGLNTEYPDVIKSLHLYTDDIIFFSELLSKDLMIHGKNILNKYRKLSKSRVEIIHEVDFKEPRDAGLMPEESDYTQWLKGYPNATETIARSGGLIKQLKNCVSSTTELV